MASGPDAVGLANTTETSSIFTGVPDRHYAFCTIATDNVGQVEPAPQSPDVEVIIIPSFVIDDGDVGLLTDGFWTCSLNPNGSEGDVRNSFIGRSQITARWEFTSLTAGSGSNTATWTFTGLTPGNYHDSATWFAHANQATNSPFSIFDGTAGPLLERVLVNQRMAPDDFSDSGSDWENLTVVTITSQPSS